MSLPSFRPALPPCSSMPAPHGPYQDVLLAQEEEEERRVAAEARKLRCESQNHSCAEDNETTPWLKHTGWPRLFQDRPLDIITASSRQPAYGPNRSEEDRLLGAWQGVQVRSSAAAENQLRLLMRSVDDMFDRAEATLACTSYRSRCWLSSYWKETFYCRPLKMLPLRTRKRYRSQWKDFLSYLFRAISFGSRQRREMYGVPLRKDEMKMMRYILGLVSQLQEEKAEVVHGVDGEVEAARHVSGEYDDDDEDEDEDEDDDDAEEGENESEEEDESGQENDDENAWPPGQRNFYLPRNQTRLRLAEALFQLSMMFWTHQCHAGVMASSALIHFTAVMGVHRSSLAYRTAFNSTPGLAALLWVGRLLFLEYSLPLYGYNTLAIPWPARDTYPSQPERLETIRAKYMLRGCHSPLGEILELKAVGQSIVKQEGSTGNLTWAPDGRSFTIGDDKEVQMSDFCATYHAAITRVEERAREMMLGWEPAVDLTMIRDDLTCRVPGRCFLDKPENGLAGKFKAMARRAWSSSFRGEAMAKGGHWLPGPCQAYLDAGIELASTLNFPACHLTMGLPGRGSEVTSIRLRNTELAIRNVFVREGQIVIVISYNKARASNNHAFYTIRYLPDSLGKAVLVYLVYIRPFLDFLSNQLRLRQYHSNEFLFPDPKHTRKHLSSEQATMALRRLTRGLRTPWTLSLYRQAAIAIAKRYISELIKKRNFYYPSSASTPTRIITAGVGHHPRMLLTAYAIDKAMPARLQPELFEMYRELSTMWQKWNLEYFEDHCVDPANTVERRCISACEMLPTTKRKSDASHDEDAKALKKRKKTPTAGLEASGFIFNDQYEVVICVACESMIQPGRKAAYRHLNAKHRITGPLCKELVDQLSAFKGRKAEEVLVPQEQVPAIPGLKVQKAFYCTHCRFFTIHRPRMHDHMRIHELGICPMRAQETGVYSECYV